MTTERPFIGITTDAADGKLSLTRAFVDWVVRAGGVPVLLPCVPDCVEAYLDRCAGIVLSSGDDPDTGQWGIPLHPKARPIDPDRQAFEWALLEAAERRERVPLLGVCLGMQMMALHAGGALDQHMPDHLSTAADHWGRKVHRVSGELGAGDVLSNHRQAITDPGSLRVVAVAHDGVIEAVRSDNRSFYVGVQWHPERTDDDRLGVDLVRSLVAAAAHA